MLNELRMTFEEGLLLCNLVDSQIEFETDWLSGRSQSTGFPAETHPKVGCDGDKVAMKLVEKICTEEIDHVRKGVKW